jgi:hypothetical protein
MRNEFSKPRATKLMRTLALGFAATAALAFAPDRALAQRQGDLHIIKDCTGQTPTPGSFCTITSSNLAAVPAGSRVYYDQAPYIPTTQFAPMLDSNVVLSVGSGDWATGRCTIDYDTALGICQFTDGTGPLTGFQARVNVSYAGTGADFRWEGTYSFASQGALK